MLNIKTGKSLLIMLVLALLGLMSCKIHCPEFDKEILSWIPYQENDVIELYSQSNDSTILISIKSVDVTHTTSYRGKCDCGDYIFIGDGDSNFQIDIRSEGNIIGSQSYQIGNTYFNEYDTYSEIENFLFESQEYDIVRIFEKKDSKSTFKKLIIAKDIGIIGLIDNDGNTWTLKTNVKIRKFNEPNERKNIVIKNVSC